MTVRAVRTTATALILRDSPSGTDTGKRFVAGQVAASFGESWDKDWQFITTPNGDGWASSSYLVPSSVAVPAPARLLYTLEGEDPELTEKVEKLCAAAAAEGIEFTTADFGGVRTQADTTRILKYRDDDYAVYVRNLKRDKPNAKPVHVQRWRPIAPFGSSFHNFGCARDLKITKRPASFSESAALQRVGVLAEKLGLRWGGRFKTKVDPPHVELAITLAEARARWKARTS